MDGEQIYIRMADLLRHTAPSRLAPSKTTQLLPAVMLYSHTPEAGAPAVLQMLTPISLAAPS